MAIPGPAGGSGLMAQAIKLTMDQMRLMSLFQSVTKVTAKDCVEDGKQNRVIFVVEEGQMGLSIGRHGAHMKSLQAKVQKNVELVEFREDPAAFLKGVLNPKLVSEVKVSERPDGTTQAVVLVDQGNKGLVVGREGRNAEKARLLAKRYFGIAHVMINSPERALFG